jgi:GNAT superfamily N-acetyltransferase
MVSQTCPAASRWVALSHRGQGLATRLIAAAEAEAAARGCLQMIHFAYSFQPQELYERVGYELVARVVTDFPSGIKALGFRKPLHPAEFPHQPTQTRSR